MDKIGVMIYSLSVTLILSMPIAFSGSFTCVTSGNTLKCDIPNIEYLSNISICNQLYNKPKMITSGTEYSPNENGKVFLRLLDGNENPINLGSCNTTVYYPNNTEFINSQSMTFLKKGFYYYDFVIPNILGNYIVGFDCKFPSTMFFQNQSYGGLVITGTEPFTSYFPFDNSNNVTVNNANLSVAVSSGVYNVYLNSNLVLNNVGNVNLTILTYSTNLLPTNFTVTENQYYMIECVSGCPMNFYWISLYVNYTWDNPLYIVRGQNEIHITNTTISVNDTIKQVNSSISNMIENANFTIINNSNSNYFSLVGILNTNFTEVFNKLNTIANMINSLSNNMAYNFTNTNNLIYNTNNTIVNILNAGITLSQMSIDKILYAISKGLGLYIGGYG